MPTTDIVELLDPVMTPDGVPIVGKVPDLEGMYLGVGMCGQGFMLGPGVAENLAALIVEGKPVIDEEVFELVEKAPRPDVSAKSKVLTYIASLCIIELWQRYHAN